MKLSYKAPKTFTYDSFIAKASTKFGDSMYDLTRVEAPKYVIDILHDYSGAWNGHLELVIQDGTNITLYTKED